VCRRQELRELRLLQKEEQRAQAGLNAKLETQREQMQRRIDQEMNVSPPNGAPLSGKRPVPELPTLLFRDYLSASV